MRLWVAWYGWRRSVGLVAAVLSRTLQGAKPTLGRLAPTSEDYSGKLTDWAPAHGPISPKRWKKKKSRKREFSKMRRIF